MNLTCWRWVEPEVLALFILLGTVLNFIGGCEYCAISKLMYSGAEVLPEWRHPLLRIVEVECLISIILISGSSSLVPSR